MAHLAHYKEAHPLPFVITHWVNLICMILLIFTGFMIHYPFLAGMMGVARGVHIFSGFIVTINCLIRVIMAFTVKSAPNGGTRELVPDYKTYLPQKDNRHQFGAWIKYYLFLQKKHPLSAKLGVPQKLSYLLIPFIIIAMFWSGIALWIPTSEFGINAWLIAAVGGVVKLRILHYFGMWVIIGFALIHIYLANIEGLSPSKVIFFQKEAPGYIYDPETQNIIGYDDMGTGEKH